MRWCPISVSLWLVRDGTEFLYLGNHTAFGTATGSFRNFKLLVWTPPYAPKGHYVTRTFAQCQRNPLEGLTQVMADLSINIGVPLVAAARR